MSEEWERNERYEPQWQMKNRSSPEPMLEIKRRLSQRKRLIFKIISEKFRFWQLAFFLSFIYSKPNGLHLSRSLISIFRFVSILPDA